MNQNKNIKFAAKNTTIGSLSQTSANVNNTPTDYVSAKKYESRAITKPMHQRRMTRLHQLMKMAAMLLLFLSLTGLVRAQSALDGFDPNANGDVRVVVVQPDGKILIGGGFTTLSPNGGAAVTRNGIARLNPDGTLDTAFNPNASGTNSFVSSIAVQADGKILVGGEFGEFLGTPTIGGQTRNGIARLDATTGLADSFDPNAFGGSVYSIAVQADGKILIGGPFSVVGGQTRNRIARLDPATGLADSFNPNANGTVYSIALQADGKILVGGGFNVQFGTPTIGGQTRNGIARLDATTGLADSFNPNADPTGNFGSTVNSIAVQADGKILAGGGFVNIGGQTRHNIARLDPTTGLADSFNPNPNANSIVLSIAAQADGKILAGGIFTTLSPNGGPSVTRNNIARLETDGRLDQTLNPSVGGTSAIVLATAIQADGKILIGGRFSAVLGIARNNIARLNTDGTLDTAFNSNANGQVDAIAVQADGKILAGGEFTSVGGQTRRRIARLDGITGAADSFDPNANNTVDSIAVQADGKILAGGGFSGAISMPSIGGQTRTGIARLDATTGLADSFNPNANGAVSSIAVQADGKILAGGGFNGANSIGGQTRNFIARLDATTGLADSFNPNANSVVVSIAVQADGKILAGGFFSGANGIGGQTRNYIARLDATTGLADSFDPNANNFVLSIAVQANGKILAGGLFTSIGGQTRNYIARLDATTGAADSFNPNADSQINSIALQADGKVLAGGFFTNIGGQPRSLFARLTNDTAALQSLAVTQTTITWTRGGSSPQFAGVTFESSTDNVNYTPLGDGTASGSNWTLTALSLPTGQNIYIRARGYYGSGEDNGSESIAESVRNAFLAGPQLTPTLGNISTRLRVETGDNVLIGGFIVTGTQAKKVIVRAIGPSLTLAGVLANPALELRNSSGGLIAANDNWRSDQEAEIIATTIPPSNDLESAIVATLPANNSSYTAIVRGVNDGTGIGVVEAYDLDQAVDSKLGNISTRGLVQTGDDVMIGGLIVLGQAPLRVIVRAIGPSLSVAGALGNPTLELRDGNGALIAANDNWRSDHEAEITATGIPPSNDLESAIVQNLTPGNYTAIVRGVSNTTGVALVEAYGLN